MQSQESLLDYYLDENRCFCRMPYYKGMITCLNRLTNEVINNNLCDYDRFIRLGERLYDNRNILLEKRVALLEKIKEQVLTCPISSDTSTVGNVVYSKKIAPRNRMASNPILYDIPYLCTIPIEPKTPINIRTFHPLNEQQLAQLDELVAQHNVQVTRQNLE